MKKIYILLCIGLTLLSTNAHGARLRNLIKAYNHIAQQVHNPQKNLQINDELLEQCYQKRIIPLLKDAATPEVKDAWKDVTASLVTHIQQGDSAQAAVASTECKINNLYAALRKVTIFHTLKTVVALIAVGIFALGGLTGAVITHVIDHHHS